MTSNSGDSEWYQRRLVRDGVKRKPFTLYVHPDLHARLKEFCEKRDQPMNEVIILAIMRLLEDG